MRATFLSATTDSAVDSSSLEFIKIALSIVFLTALNVILLGKIVSTVISLDKTGSDFFRIRLPGHLDIGLNGQEVAAGFCSFAVFLMLTLFVFREHAINLFLHEIPVTESAFTACQFEATLIGIPTMLVGCLIYKSQQSRRELSIREAEDESQVKKLTED